MKKSKQQTEKTDTTKPKRPFIKSDFEVVIKAATKPLKKEQDGKESAET